MAQVIQRRKGVTPTTTTMRTRTPAPNLEDRKTFAGVEYCFRALTPTFMARETQRQSGTLATLAEVTEVRGEQIAAANGIAYEDEAINAWVIASGGHWSDYDAGLPPPSPTGGWALFTVGNRLWVPCTAMDDWEPGAMTTTTAEQPAPAESAPTSGLGAAKIAAGLGIVAGLAYAVSRSKKRRR